MSTSLLYHADQAVRMAAMTAVGHLAQAEQGLAPLIEAFQNAKHDDERRRAAAALDALDVKDDVAPD